MRLRINKRTDPYGYLGSEDQNEYISSLVREELAKEVSKNIDITINRSRFDGTKSYNAEIHFINSEELEIIKDRLLTLEGALSGMDCFKHIIDDLQIIFKTYKPKITGDSIEVRQLYIGYDESRIIEI